MDFFKKTKRLKLIAAGLLCMLSLNATMPATGYAAVATWSAHPASDAAGWADLTWSPERRLFVAVASSRLMTSPDGITWTSHIVPAVNWRAVAWSSDLGMFVVLGNSSTLLTSTDGITWASQTMPVVRTWNSVIWSPEQHQFVAVGLSASSAATSPDGINWTKTTNVSLPVLTTSIAWSASDNLYVVSSTSTNTVYVSPDGASWTQQSVPIDNSRGITYAADKDLFVMVGTNGIATSPDGASWTVQSSPITNLLDVTYSPENSEFVAVGSDGMVASPDGITWTPVTLPAASSWKSIVWSAELSRYVAVANSGTDRTMVGIVPTKPSAPINLTAALSGQKIDLSWTMPNFDGNSTITSYHIERSVNGGPFTTLVADTGSSATVFADQNVSPGMAYIYRVYALNNQGQSVASNQVTVTVGNGTSSGSELANTGMNVEASILFSFVLLTLGIVIYRKYNPIVW